MGKLRDSQRQAVYDWENSIFPNGKVETLTLGKCEGLVRMVFQDYQVDSQGLYFSDGRGRSWARGGHYRIILPRWARTDVVSLHEAAHTMISRRLKERNLDWWTVVRPHGKLFASLVLELWGRYAGLDTVLARKAGITQKPRRVRFCSSRVLRDFFPKPKRLRHARLREILDMRGKTPSQIRAEKRKNRSSDGLNELRAALSLF